MYKPVVIFAGICTGYSLFEKLSYYIYGWYYFHAKLLSGSLREKFGAL